MGWNIFNRVRPVPIVFKDYRFFLGLKRFGGGQEALVRKHGTIPYEKAVIEDFVKEVEKLKQGVVVDCGAYQGFYGLLASRINPNLRVFAIEPLLENIQRLNHNIEINGFRNIKIYEYAVGRESKTTHFYHSRNKAWTAVGLDHPSLKRRKGGTVQQKSMAEFMSESGIETIDILKMDIEGAEFEALSSLNLEKVRMVYVETHPNLLKERGGQSVRMVIDLLGSKDFKLTFCPDFGETFFPVDKKAGERHGYLVAKKN